MSKLSFKRIALAVVATLGLGVLSSGPSIAAPVASSDVLTLSATTASIAAGETASVTLTLTGITGGAGESMAVRVADQSLPTGGDGKLGFYITDSSNAYLRVTGIDDAAAKADNQADSYGLAGTAADTNFDIIAGTDAATPFSITGSLRLMAPSVAGTYTYQIYMIAATGTTYTYVSTPKTLTITVTANTADTGTTASKMWLNRLAEYQAFWAAGGDPTGTTYKGIEADSALVVSAGTLGSYNAVAVLNPVVLNSSDTKISSRTSARVQESVTVTISGPGMLETYKTNRRNSPGLTGTKTKQVTIAYDETIVVYSDGVAGVGTITSYIGSSAVSTKAFTQGTKSVTFVGRATTFTVTGFTAGQRAGGNAPYRSLADSATATGATIPSMGAGYVPVIRFVAKDAAGNVVTTSALSTDKGDAVTNFYAISSDTSIIAAGEPSATNTFATNTARRNAALTCSYDSVNAYWYCQGRVFDSGTVTLTIVDSRTITANGNSTTSTTDAVYKSDAFSITLAGDGNTGTLALDKSTYTVNEKATITTTCKDGMGRVVADATYAGCFTSLSWKSAAPSFGQDNSASSAGGRFSGDLATYLTGTPSFFGGVDTAMVYMPTVAGTYTLQGKTGTATAVTDLLTFTVTDPVQDAQNAAIAASQKASVAAAAAAAATAAVCCGLNTEIPFWTAAVVAADNAALKIAA